ncbi:MAG: hypothetical protein K8F91_12640 [Candidatus Obscuribacterales bacterium]|nr:hypothetical protein [Candidatus Obscuribacterales bacterium]
MVLFNMGLQKSFCCLFLVSALAATTGAGWAEAGVRSDALPTAQQLDAGRKFSDENPADAKAKFEYAELLRQAGKTADASNAYLQVSEIDAAFYVAYHQLSLICQDQSILAEAVKRLEYLLQTKPKELLLRVSLSELLEKQGDYYRASRTLIDLVFADAVPPKYAKLVNDRIRFLQAKAREVQVLRKASEIKLGHGDVDLPLPDETLKKGLYASRPEHWQQQSLSETDLNDTGFGNTRLHH